MSGEVQPSPAGYVIVPANSIEDEQLLEFAALVWPERPRQRILGSWWRRAEPDCAVAAIQQWSGRMVGLCAGRPSEWVIGGRAHPAVAICDWYVSPDQEGKLLGRRLIRRFEAPERILYAFSISDVGIAYANRLGWAGPHPSSLMVLPIPRLMRFVRSGLGRHKELELQDYDIAGGGTLGALAADLDRIEMQRARHPLARMRRDAEEWSWRLSVCGDRRYRFYVARRAGSPVGYVVVRQMTPGASRMLGSLKGAIITDLVAVDDDQAVLRALAIKAVEFAAEIRATVVLMASTTRPHRRALVATGFLSPGFPLLGRLLQRRSPVFMWLPRGPASGLSAAAMEITFADSDVDLAL